MIYICNNDEINKEYLKFCRDLDKENKYSLSKDLKDKWNSKLESMSYDEIKEYVRDYYLLKLKDLDVKELYSDLNGCFILSGSSKDEVSYNMIIGSYLELLLNVNAEYIRMDDYKLIKKKKKYIINFLLEQIINEYEFLKFNDLEIDKIYKDSEELLEKSHDMSLGVKKCNELFIKSLELKEQAKKLEEERKKYRF